MISPARLSYPFPPTNAAPLPHPSPKSFRLRGVYKYLTCWCLVGRTFQTVQFAIFDHCTRDMIPIWHKNMKQVQGRSLCTPPRYVTIPILPCVRVVSGFLKHYHDVFASKVFHPYPLPVCVLLLCLHLLWLGTIDDVFFLNRLSGVFRSDNTPLEGLVLSYVTS